MPSLVFIYDITERLAEEALDYLVLVICECVREVKIDVFFYVRKESHDVFNP